MVATILKHLSFVVPAQLFAAAAVAAPPAPPNDCWSGFMGDESAAHGRLVATGRVAQWRVGAPIVFYTTIEDDVQIKVLAEQGETGTFDTAHPITLTPVWISGPEPGDKDNPEEAKNIEVTLQYRTAQGTMGKILLTYWTPLSGKDASLPPDHQVAVIAADWIAHDGLCRGIP